jgi:ammonia channel protein AmtB
MTSATIGVFVLWLGWFGFNPGSTMALDPKAIAHVAVSTNMAAAAASISALFTAIVMLGKPDLSMILNGCLAGLVAIIDHPCICLQQRPAHALCRSCVSRRAASISIVRPWMARCLL